MQHGRVLIRSAAAAALFASAAIAATPLPSAASLSGAPRDGWAGYAVPVFAGARPPCCYALERGEPVRRGCDLDRNRGMTINGGDTPAAPGDRLQVYLRFRAGAIEQVRAYAAECPVRHEGELVTLTGIDSAASAALLGALVDAAEDDDEAIVEGAITAIAFHGGGAATERLVGWAERDGRESVRMPALFWLGHSRGDTGAEVLVGVARSAAPRAIRNHAVFALAQSESATAYPAIAAIARADRDREVRGQAAFWLAQTGDPRAAADLEALVHDGDHEVARQAVFALSQLDEGGDAALVAIVRGDYPREVKKQALFWLGQSGSEQAMELFDEVLGAK